MYFYKKLNQTHSYSFWYFLGCVFLYSYMYFLGMYSGIYLYTTINCLFIFLYGWICMFEYFSCSLLNAGFQYHYFWIDRLACVSSVPCIVNGPVYPMHYWLSSDPEQTLYWADNKLDALERFPDFIFKVA